MIARTFFAVLAALIGQSLNAAEVQPFKDDFSAPKLEPRRAMRGDWKFADGVASCKQDDELYKKNKDHGPIIFYHMPYTDATIHFAYQADAAVKTVVFTCNSEEGHVFRFASNAAGTGFRAFDPASKEHSAKTLGLEKALSIKAGEWVPVTVTLRGTKATVKIGTTEKTFEHTPLAKEKSNWSIGFSFGTLKVKDVSVAK